MMLSLVLFDYVTIYHHSRGQKGQKIVNETEKHISNPPPSNETLSHSNGKVVFDHEHK